MNKKLAVIIVTYNAGELIRQCLEFLAQCPVPKTIIVIDNASTDETLKIICEFANVELIKNERNLGFGVANNLGISAGIKMGAEFFFLLNQDAFVNPNTLDLLCQTAIQSPGFGIYSPVHLNASGNDYESAWVQSYLHEKHCPGFLMDKQDGNMRKIYPARFTNAAAWLLTLECVEKIGGFSPVFFLYGEDDDYVNRMRFHGLPLAIVPGSEVRHLRIPGKVGAKARFAQQMKKIRRNYFLQMEIDLSDPNKRQTSEFFTSVYKQFRIGAGHFIRLKFRDCFLIFVLSCQYLLKTPKILRSRQKAVRASFAFLDLK